MLFFIVLAPGVIFYEYLSFTRLGFPLVIKTEDKVFHTWDVGATFSVRLGRNFKQTELCYLFQIQLEQ